MAAAATLATDLGLRDVEPRLLRDSSNVLLHLRPYPLVARVATLTALRPGVHRWLASDIEPATFLHARGLPVVHPSTDPPAGPHDVGGITIALRRYVEHDPSALVEPASLVSLLGSLHAGMREFPGTLAADGPRADLERALTLLSGSVDPGLLAADGSRLGAAVYRLPAQPLQATPIPGTCWSPCRVCRALREVFAVAWQQLLAVCFPAQAAEARAALAEYAERHDQGYYDGGGVAG